MAVTDADRIAAEGEQITLADGSVRTLRFDLRAMLAIERKLGSVGEFAKGLDAGLGTGGIAPLLAGISAALQGEPALDEEQLLALMDSKEFQAYQIAALRAFMQALPESRESGKGQAPANGSPGPSSTDSTGPLSIVPTPTSGE